MAMATVAACLPTMHMHMSSCPRALRFYCGCMANKARCGATGRGRTKTFPTSHRAAAPATCMVQICCDFVPLFIIDLCQGLKNDLVLYL